MTTTADNHATSAVIEISDPSHLSADPVVSVLMLAYNHGAYLAEAIEGVLMQQTDFAIELLIGDDCSSDNTREIALRYQQTHPDVIRVITSATNVGARRNRRRLAHAVRGEFIAFCEGDDFWTSPAKLQLQVEYLRRHPNAGAVHSEFSHTLFRGGKWRTLANFQRTVRGSVPEGQIFPQLLAGNFIQTCTLCVRTHLDRQYLGSEFPVDSYPVGDWPLCLFIAAQSKIGYLPQSLATYRKVPGSAMNSGHVASLRYAKAYRSIVEDFATYALAGDSVRKSALSSLHKTILSLAFLANDSSTFEASWHWLQEHDPALLSPLRRRLLRWALPRRSARWMLIVLLNIHGLLRERRLYRSMS